VLIPPLPVVLTIRSFLALVKDQLAPKCLARSMSSVSCSVMVGTRRDGPGGSEYIGDVLISKQRGPLTCDATFALMLRDAEMSSTAILQNTTPCLGYLKGLTNSTGLSNSRRPRRWQSNLRAGDKLNLMCASLTALTVCPGHGLCTFCTPVAMVSSTCVERSRVTVQ
jgi:hypothetical protein